MKRKCPNCQTLLQEIRKAEITLKGERRIVDMYPKPIREPNVKRTYHEYRFYCPKEKTEWIMTTTPKGSYWSEVPKDSQFAYLPNKGLLVMKLTKELAEKIKQTILEYQDNYSPHIIENIEIVGGIRERGYSYNDIDFLVCWNCDNIYNTIEIDHIKRTLEHIVNFWLKKHDYPIAKLDIYSFVRLGVYNLGYWGGWNPEMFTAKKEAEVEI